MHKGKLYYSNNQFIKYKTKSKNTIEKKKSPSRSKFLEIRSPKFTKERVSLKYTKTKTQLKPCKR